MFPGRVGADTSARAIARSPPGASVVVMASVAVGSNNVLVAILVAVMVGVIVLVGVTVGAGVGGMDV